MTIPSFDRCLNSERESNPLLGPPSDVIIQILIIFATRCSRGLPRKVDLFSDIGRLDNIRHIRIFIAALKSPTQRNLPLLGWAALGRVVCPRSACLHYSWWTHTIRSPLWSIDFILSDYRSSELSFDISVASRLSVVCTPSHDAYKLSETHLQG